MPSFSSLRKKICIERKWWWTGIAQSWLQGSFASDFTSNKATTECSIPVQRLCSILLYSVTNKCKKDDQSCWSFSKNGNNIDQCQPANHKGHFPHLRFLLKASNLSHLMMTFLISTQSWALTNNKACCSSFELFVPGMNQRTVQEAWQVSEDSWQKRRSPFFWYAAF